MLIALAVTLAFALLARLLRGVNRSGMAAGGIACFALFAGAGPGAFAVLAVLFLVTWGSTRAGRARKQELGVAERREGRNGWQVSANLGIAVACTVLFGAGGKRAWIVAVIAALAEAATDTVASEIGQSRNRTAIMITSWKAVPAGTDGGITASGTLAGAAGGALVVMVAAAAGLLAAGETWIPLVAGLIGMLFDSLLGASVQKRGWMSNEAVNFWATALAAGMAWVLSSS
ncbi:MAG TPA: DUF92 domain-containing protein [Terriglobales bacterium]|nr:DUF92 domain-containing protein [Terriglobales bacterium]